MTLFVLITLTALFAAAGLVLDGGRMLAAREDAHDVATSAARAGTQAVDATTVNGAAPGRVAPEAAARAAQAFLAAEGYTGTARAAGDTVIVTVSIPVRPLLLLGIGTRTATGTGSARPVRGS
ncbi:MAG: hypothetical protein HYX34_05320 [Actinobacteria bacterium]|nr:hypothetical protein [Actinomycetota bacterium]